MAINDRTVESTTNRRLLSAPIVGQRLQAAWRAWTAPGAVFYAATMVANAFGFVYVFIMARLLHVDQYGEVVTLTALAYVFGVVTRSLQAKSAQAVTEARTAAGTRGAAGALVLRQMTWPLLASTVGMFAIGALASPPAASFLRMDSAWPVVLLAAYVATHFLLSGPRGVLLGSDRLYFLSWVTLVDPIVRLVAGWLFVRAGLGTNGAMLGYVAGNLVATVAAVLPFLGSLVATRGRAKGTGKWLAYDKQFLFALLINGALMGVASVDPVAIRRFFSETVAGNYAVAFLLGRVILLSTNAVSWVVFSRTVHLDRDDPRARGILVRGLVLGGLIAGLFTLAYWVAPDLAARAMGGRQFQGAGSFVGLVGLEMVIFTFVSVLAYYHMAVRNTGLLWAFGTALAAEAVLIGLFHGTPQQILYDTMLTLTGLLVWGALETRRVFRPLPAAADPGRQPRMCMVVHSHYPSDPRVRREAEALIEAGWEVDLICVPDEGQPRTEVVNQVRVFRMPVQRQRNGGPLTYLREYGTFFALASARLIGLHLRQPYQVVQAHNMPDFLVFTGLVPKLLGARVVLDVHDLVPEFYAVRFKLPLDHPVIKVTRWVQKLSARFACGVLTAGEPFRRELIKAGIRADKITSIMNSPDPALFFPRPATPRTDSQFVLSYHGSLSEYNDLALVLRAIALVRQDVPELVFRVFGRGRSLPELQALAVELGLNNQVQFLGFRPLDQVPDLIAGADLGIVPQRRSVFTSLNYPTKAFEYIALGAPVLMSWTPALEEMFGHIGGIFFQPDSAEELAERIRSLHANRELARDILGQQQQACAGIAWVNEKRRYVAAINALQPAPVAALETVTA